MLGHLGPMLGHLGIMLGNIGVVFEFWIHDFPSSGLQIRTSDVEFMIFLVLHTFPITSELSENLKIEPKSFQTFSEKT